MVETVIVTVRIHDQVLSAVGSETATIIASGAGELLKVSTVLCFFYKYCIYKYGIVFLYKNCICKYGIVFLL